MIDNIYSLLHIRSRHESINSQQIVDSIFIRDKIHKNINSLNKKLRWDLWGVLFFALISIFALLFSKCKPLEGLPDIVLTILGVPPSPFMVLIVLAISIISSLIIILGHLINGDKPGGIWSQVIFISIFYSLFFLSESLDNYFRTVFILSALIVGLKYLSVWRYYTTAITIENNLLRKLSLWPLCTFDANLLTTL